MLEVGIPKGLNRIDNIGEGHLIMRKENHEGHLIMRKENHEGHLIMRKENHDGHLIMRKENLSFNNNYIIWEL